MKKIKTESGKWKKLVRNSQKKLVAATMAGAIMGTAIPSMSAHAWTARTPEQIKIDIGNVQAINELSRYNLRYGDTLWGISQATGFSVLDISSQYNIPDVNFIRAGRTLEGDHVRGGGATQQSAGTHSVVYGDTLSKLALRYGVTVEQLASWNNIQNVDLIYVGETFIVREDAVVPGNTSGQTSNNSSGSGVATPTPQAPVEDDDTGNFGAVGNEDNKTDNKEEDVVEDEVDVDNEPEEDDTGNFGAVEDDSEDTDEEPTPEPEPEPEPTPDPDPTPEPEEDIEVIEKEVVNPETGVEVEETEPEVIPDDSEEVEVQEPTETPVEPEEDPNVVDGDKEVIEPKDPEDEESVEISVAERTETSQVGFKEVKRENPDLPLGEERVVQEGSFGTLVKTYQVTFEDGVEVSSEFVSEEVTVNPVDKIVEFGTYVEPKPVITTSTRTETENLPFERVTLGNPEMWDGDTEVVQTGSYGKVVREYKVTYSDGVEVSVELINETRTESVNEVIHVGTKPEVSTKTRTEKETVAFDTVERDNANLLEGQTRVAQEGVNGERTITYEQTYIRGEFDSEKQVSSEITKKPVNKIIEVGTKKKPVITWGTETKTLDIPFSVEVVEVTNLPVGQEKVVVEGRNGQRDIVYKQTFEDGVLVDVELLSDAVTRQPVTKVVHKGVRKGEIAFDQQVFSQELLKLVNELRVKVGVHKLTYDNTLQKGTDIRAREVLDVFSHTRPDGRHFITAFGYEGTNYYLGENIAGNYITTEVNVERDMAKKFFNQYYNSAGHYENMVSDRYITFATAATLGANNKVSNAQIFGTKNR